ADPRMERPRARRRAASGCGLAQWAAQPSPSQGDGAAAGARYERRPRRMKPDLKVIDTEHVKRTLAVLVESMGQRPRPVRIVYKHTCFHQRAAAFLLWALTFGGQRTYRTDYVATLGHTIYVPADFDRWEPAHALSVLRHELVHVAQFERWGFLGMVLLYGLLPLPLGLAYGRARLEWEAYRETLRAVAEVE